MTKKHPTKHQPSPTWSFDEHLRWTDKDILNMVEFYRETIAVMDVSDSWKCDGAAHDETVEDVKRMSTKISDLVLSGQRDEAMRWLGFLQGVLFCCGIFDLKRMWFR